MTPDLVVLSDLHLGRGKNPETGRYHRLEAFFYDDDFAAFCRWLVADARARGAALRLVLNGDVFDLLRIEPEPPGPAAPAAERRFGAPLSPPRAAARLAMILEGHPGVVGGLALLVAEGHEVVFLPGNHDPELQWAPVQAEVRRALAARLHAEGHADGDVASALGRLRFEPWFHYEPGRVWIEHGCQYDPEGAFRYPLRGPYGERPEAAPELERDLPLGNFFQRYLYNGFGPITFVVPSSSANQRYLRWLLVHRPRFLARVVFRHLPFVWQLARRVGHAGAAPGALPEVHAAELAAVAARTGLGERLAAVDALKEARGDVGRELRAVGRQGLLAVLGGVALALLGAGLWFAGFHVIQQLRSGFGLKAVLFLALQLVMLAAAGLGLGWGLLRAPAPPARPLPRAAQAIARLVDVPLVVFSHLHEESIARLALPDRTGWYFNTGTWIAVFVRDVLLPRERLQLTFLRARGAGASLEAELLHWSPGRGAPVPVVLLDDEREAASAAAAHPETTAAVARAGAAGASPASGAPAHGGWPPGCNSERACDPAPPARTDPAEPPPRRASSSGT